MDCAPEKDAIGDGPERGDLQRTGGFQDGQRGCRWHHKSRRRSGGVLDHDGIETRR